MSEKPIEWGPPECRVTLFVGFVDKGPEGRANDQDLRLAGYVSASQLADVTAKLEQLQKHRALEQHVLRRRLANQKTELRQLGKRYRDTSDAANKMTQERNDLNEALGFVRGHSNSDLLGALSDLKVRLQAAECALEQAYVLAEEVGAIVGLDDDESLQTRLVIFRDAYARHRSATEGAKPAEPKYCEQFRDPDGRYDEICGRPMPCDRHPAPGTASPPSQAEPLTRRRNFTELAAKMGHPQVSLLAGSPPSPAQSERRVNGHIYRGDGENDFCDLCGETWGARLTRRCSAGEAGIRSLLSPVPEPRQPAQTNPHNGSPFESAFTDAELAEIQPPSPAQAEPVSELARARELFDQAHDGSGVDKDYLWSSVGAILDHLEAVRVLSQQPPTAPGTPLTPRLQRHFREMGLNPDEGTRSDPLDAAETLADDGDAVHAVYAIIDAIRERTDHPVSGDLLTRTELAGALRKVAGVSIDGSPLTWLADELERAQKEAT
jgi:hypothetical protein